MYNVVQMLQQGQNPQQIVMSILQQQQNNPMAANLINLAQQGNTQELEKIARNITKEQGKDFDTEFKAFRQRLGFK